MKHSPANHLPAQQTPRHGFTVTELLVSALLLTSVMSLVGPLAVRSGRLWQDARQGRLALEELSNQLDRLTYLSEDQRNAALAELEPAESIRKALPNPQLTAEILHDRDGQRLVLQLTWDRVGTPGRCTLVGWLNTKERM